MRKDERLTIAPLSEYHWDLLVVSAWLARRSVAQQASVMVSENLDRSIDEIRSQIAYLAEKRGISEKDLWNEIINGNG